MGPPRTLLGALIAKWWLPVHILWCVNNNWCHMLPTALSMSQAGTTTAKLIYLGPVQVKRQQVKTIEIRKGTGQQLMAFRMETTIPWGDGLSTKTVQVNLSPGHFYTPPPPNKSIKTKTVYIYNLCCRGTSLLLACHTGCMYNTAEILLLLWYGYHRQSPSNDIPLLRVQTLGHKYIQPQNCYQLEFLRGNSPKTV